ncbi:chemotaxis protein CheB [Deinococcus irradiatisoli]|uniref:protein-glutamate methylesterase n=1 Tax=Deinococcus irradiatisoli TaxID=2202254 RepID=A0A2Z3JHR5_9DEIO|nr:chemotaxis protein CheB [Deinococcus irradiatisoli]
MVGGSAGALEPLRELVAHLPADFPAALLVVIHCPPDLPSYLPQILQSAGSLPVSAVQQPAALESGHIYVAPPNRHLLVGRDEVRPSRGPRENRSRPSVDVLFRSAAYTHRASVIGVLLSGMLGDGTSGLWTIKRLGGQAIVQHPEEALYPSMPLSALQEVAVDTILPVRDIAGDLLTRLGAPNFGQGAAEMDEHEWRRLQLEVSIADEGNAFAGGILTGGDPSPFTCPECHGTMVKIQEGRTLRFRCHTGHAYSAPALLGELHRAAEANLWTTVRGMEEQVMLLDHLAKHAAEAGQLHTAELYRSEAAAVRRRIEPLRRLLWQDGALPVQPVE